MKALVDSSFLVSLYVTDRHSTMADQAMTFGCSVLITPFNRAELANALYQQVFQRRSALVEAQDAWNDFELDCRSRLWLLVDFPARAWEISVELASQFSADLGVRTLDTLHVACAMALAPDRFWTFDERQARLAEAAGFETKMC